MDNRLVMAERISYLGKVELPRGYRNNNPGNIEMNPRNNWKGRIHPDKNTDGRFEQFEDLVFGVRALIILLRDSYIQRQGLNTVPKIIARFAPSHENNTKAYTHQVCQALSVRPSDIISTDRDTMYKLVLAISKHENGYQLITEQIFLHAWSIS